MDGDVVIPSIYVDGSPGNMTPERAQSPPIQRPVPESPLRPSPISPLSETMYMPLNMDSYAAQTPSNTRINQYESRLGPHELDAGIDVYRLYDSTNSHNL